MKTVDYLLKDCTDHPRIVGCPEEAIDKLVSNQRGDDPSKHVIRILRGIRCETTDRVFQEFAAALQFPYYFGQNWDAFEECLGDLSWIPADARLLCITNADRVLTSSESEFRTFCSVLANVNNELHPSTDLVDRAKSIGRVCLLLQTEPPRLGETVRRFKMAGLGVTALELLSP